MPLSNPSPPSTSSTNTRNRHRKRISALRLSSDTTATLPAYIPVQSTPLDDSDRPPDYPDSAEEADSEDSANFNTYPTLSSPSLAARKSLSRRSSTAAPPSRRVVSAQSHRRKKSWAHPLPQNDEDEEDNATDPYLDALLARSVHALEMSNTLLQSTMATQTSLSEAVAAGDDFPPSPTTNTLSLRLTGAEDIPVMSAKKAGKQSRWADEIAELSRDVETLFEGPSTAAKPIPTSSRAPYALVSSSLPTPSALSGRHRRVHPSLDLRHESHLALSDHDRSHLVAPPPRAMTQYDASSSTPYHPGTSAEHRSRDDDELVSLPSTLGLRASASVSHLPLTTPPSCSAAGSLQLSNNLRLHSTLSSPRVTDIPHAPCTPAYNMLASFVARPSSQPPATQTPMLSTSPFTSSFAFLTNPRSRSSSASTNSGGMRRRSRDTFLASKSEGARTPERPSRSSTPKMTFSKSLPSAISATFQSRRPMTPPVEESSNSSSSSSEGEGPKAKLTVQSLRKILDEQPPLANPSTMTVGKLKSPGFQPRTPARTPSSAGTSTTTASVSRLFTRNKHLVTAGGRPTHSPSPSLSTPGAGPSRLGPTEEEISSAAMLSTSPPRRGALKGSRANSQVNSPSPSVPPSPALLSPTASNAPAATAGLANLGSIIPPSASLAAWTFLLKGGGNSGTRTPSTIGSGGSTPKRISFAELPEAYNSGIDDEEEDEEEEDPQNKGKGKARAKPRPKKRPVIKAAPKRRPGESSEKFRQQREGNRQRRRREQRLKRSSTDGSSSDSNLKWWNWILGVPSNVNGKRYEDRIEERLTRGGLGAGMGGSGGMGGGFGGAGEWGV